MENIIKDFKKSRLFVLYILGFIFAFTSAIPAYVNSSFLKNLTNEHVIGFIYIIGAIINLCALMIIPKILKRFGNYRVTLFSTILYFFSFIGIVFFQNIFLVLFCFVMTGMMASIIYFNLDVFIEHDSLNNEVGGIRGIYLTCINLAWLFSPWIAGEIVGISSFKHIYVATAIIMIPVILLFYFKLNNFIDPEYKTYNIFETIKTVFKTRDIKDIIISSYLLQFFFALMVIYTPIYLNEYIGFGWEEIGIIFTVMLIPFILVQVPLGRLADKKFGEKGMLEIGFIIMGISTAVIPFIHSKSIIIWAFVLFMTRVGAAMAELMNDTYFFKKVNDKNLNLINMYRMGAPVSYIIAPAIAMLVLYFLPIQNIFFFLALMMVWGLKDSSHLRDTNVAESKILIKL